ncbi:MAG: cytochrome c biogenesis protein CcdA [Elusimicrobia bacterium]|nr:cytochrome c biogenesis protein CcdA [Elusimicrobiota bacterium]
MRPVGMGAAFLAGLASFLSPCVLPLVPGYLSFITGLTIEELSAANAARAWRRTVTAAVFFVLGFSAVFTALGASASGIGRLLASHQALLSRIAGALIVLFGLHITGLLPLKWLYRVKRIDASKVAPGPAGAFVMGLAFAFGWTPCIGPILAAILALAATQDTVAQGVALLFAYSLGLGIPFILAALGLGAFLRVFARYKRFLRWGELAAGILLIAVGVLVFCDRLSWLMGILPRTFQAFSI